MKKLSIFFVSMLCLSLAALGQAKDEVLITIDQDPVTTGEFIRLISKNQGTVSAKESDIHDALDIFINFKLKVREAMAMGLDTTAQFKSEMENYRKQLGKPYLLDQEVTDELVREAYERSLWEVRASHILMGVAIDAPPADTLLAYQKAMKIREQLLKGADFEMLARENSDDPSAAENGGDLGYFTVLQMVYPFENAVYNTPVGGISEPIRTQFGYHILYVTDKRPNQGKVQVAQIWKAFNYTMTDEEKEAVKKSIYEIWERLKAGADFADLANKQSDDRASGARGGLIPQWFGFGGMHPNFVEASFALKNIGDISEPVMTNMGYHIIKLVNRKPPESYDVQYPTLLKAVKNSDRAQKSEQVVVDRLKKEYNFKVNQTAVEEFYRLVDPSIFDGRWDPNPSLQKTGTIFSLDGKNYLQRDFAKFLALNLRQSQETTIAEFVDQKFETFVHTKILEYEETRLEDKYPDFRYLMQEFHDGNLIFEVSNRMIWSKAGQDTLGLAKFYESNKQNYLWPDRIDATIVRIKGIDENSKSFKDLRKSIDEICKNMSSIDEVMNAIQKAAGEIDGASSEVQHGIFAQGDNWVVDQIKWKKGLAETLNDGSSVIITWVNQILKPEPKALDQIRGQVTADYQDFLEKEWIKALREKYPVKINENVLSQIKL